MNAAEALQSIGWRGGLPAGRLARVVAQHRASYELSDGTRWFTAQAANHFLKRGIDPAERPAVGDFVQLAATRDEIASILPRRSALTRAAAGERYQRQIIATNIDSVLVLTGLDGDFNPRRIERYLTLVEGSGARAVVVLTKADKVPDAAQQLDELMARLPPATPLMAINAKDPANVAALEPWLQPGDTVVLVGSSGAGKSTLTNSLLGETRMATGSVRESDSRGRHTTTHRALLPLPGGACLIDTPGMRELKLTGEESLELFADLDALVTRCRFADCGHGREPGCAVRQAIDNGELAAERWANYSKLMAERAQQAATLKARQQHGRARAGHGRGGAGRPRARDEE
ncbi:MAG TPA: ribosome small subunit-dependent GTPase A [Rhodanobacteraceae bacterium]|nr:ribosome small subunit-dependent GTPase A [Rhodanobacteraceae bacterium]